MRIKCRPFFFTSISGKVNFIEKSVNYHCYGFSNFTGSLEVGKKADIIILGLNKPHLTPIYSEDSHLVYAANGADVDTVIINGKVVMENRQLLTINEGDVMNEVRKIAVKIKKSMNM